MKREMLAFCASVVLASTAAYAAGDDSESKIEIIDNKLIFHAPTEKESIELALSLVKDRQISTIDLNSPGGDIRQAMRLARWIHDNKVDVVVNEFCFSSCANYLFPAGRFKYVGEQAMIGWHGGAHQAQDPEVDPKFKEAIAQYLQQAQAEETAFYQAIGVNPRLPTLGQEEGYRCQQGEQSGWFYSIDDLKKLGVTNIVLKDGEWNPLDYHSKHVCQVVVDETLG
ncbi:hypothetical protein [Photobacterium satsumensis]|uniref:hypothetical protein n=1 Tax=Photobacterium satsumensis TaxID=2910239 RepID=UPI003D1525A2